MAYEHTTMAQKKAVCSTLASDSLKPFPSISDCSLPKIPSTDDTASTFTSAVLKEEGAASAVKEEVADLMKNMQFSHMTSCTFNINLKM